MEALDLPGGGARFLRIDASFVGGQAQTSVWPAEAAAEGDYWIVDVCVHEGHLMISFYLHGCLPVCLDVCLSASVLV